MSDFDYCMYSSKKAISVDNINKLKLLNNKISRYLLNQKSKEKMVKELTIFKTY